MHLISGPLGSAVGIFESVIEALSTKDGHTPKIIASTATTRNTDKQIAALYGNRKANIFPPSGLSYDDSFFARESKHGGSRKYIGIMPTGQTSVNTQLQLFAHLFVARLEIYKQYDGNATDNYWTMVSYYNSLKEVGRTANKVKDEIFQGTSQLQLRLFNKDDFQWNYRDIPHSYEELTSRIESTEIKSTLKKLENKFGLEKGDKHDRVKNDVVGFILATNMLSVGIDIPRLNIMLINSMPQNIAEYIQASSRIGRKEKGLAITLFNPVMSRDKSYFEHFVPFHQAYYKNVEPLSVTPFTENMLDKMLATILITYIRHKVGLSADIDVKQFDISMIEGLKEIIKKRFGDANKVEYAYFSSKIDKLANEWEAKTKSGSINKYKDLIKTPSQQTDDDWTVMQSMRDIDTSTFIGIIESWRGRSK